MNRCARYEDIIARYLHGAVLLQEKEDLEIHLAVCSACEALYREAGELDRILRDLPGKRVGPPASLHARIMASLPEIQREFPLFGRGRRAAAAVASAAMAAAAAVLLAVVFRPGEAPKETVVAKIPAPAGTPPAPAPRSPEVPPAVPRAPAPKVQVIREVRIYFYYPPARSVAVTGDFNGWNPEGVPLSPSGKPGLWETQLKLRPGAYSYNFIVDGNVLVPDPNAAAQTPDGYGGTNSILLVKNGNRV